MNILKLKGIVTSLIVISLMTIFLSSCQEDYPTLESDFEIKLKYQKKIQIKDDSGLNSITLGISSDDKDAFDLHDKSAYELTALTSDELKKYDDEKLNFEREGSNDNFEVPEDDEGVHIEILAKNLNEHTAALRLYVNVPYPDQNKSAKGYSNRANWFYSNYPPHFFAFDASHNGYFNSGYQKRVGYSWAGYNWGRYLSGLNTDSQSDHYYSNKTRAVVHPTSGGYYYTVK